MRAQSLNKLTPWMFMAPAAIIMAIALLYPLGYMIFGSFRDWDPSQNISETEFVGLKNYITLFFDPAFRESLAVTLTFAVSVVVAELVIGVGLALLLDRDIKGMSVLRTLFILPMMIAPVVVGLMWRYMYHPTVGTFNRFLKSIGLDGVDWLGQHALLSVIIADIWQWTPFIFILALAALQSLPRSALEAAKIDGATAWQQIWHIKIPLMMPVLIVTALLRLIDAFKVLEVILVMTEGGPGLSTEIVALRISRTATEFRELGVAAAMSNYLLILLLMLTVAMFAITRLQEIRQARLARQIQEES
ncbi:MAG: sugar ABC transporter permease [Pseudomonadota bacterium]